MNNAEDIFDVVNEHDEIIGREPRTSVTSSPVPRVAPLGVGSLPSCGAPRASSPRARRGRVGAGSSPEEHADDASASRRQVQG